MSVLSQLNNVWILRCEAITLNIIISIFSDTDLPSACRSIYFNLQSISLWLEVKIQINGIIAQILHVTKPIRLQRSKAAHICDFPSTKFNMTNAQVRWMVKRGKNHSHKNNPQ